jgi:hypothetical protein
LGETATVEAVEALPMEAGAEEVRAIVSAEAGVVTTTLSLLPVPCSAAASVLLCELLLLPNRSEANLKYDSSEIALMEVTGEDELVAVPISVASR